MTTPKTGDRIKLRGTVAHAYDNGWVHVRFDGASGTPDLINSEALARAEIEPRPFQIGDRVVRNSDSDKLHQPVYRIAALDAHFAALIGKGDELLAEPPVALSDLTRIDGGS